LNEGGEIKGFDPFDSFDLKKGAVTNDYHSHLSPTPYLVLRGTGSSMNNAI